jgi:hypothetical protein
MEDNCVCNGSEWIDNTGIADPMYRQQSSPSAIEKGIQGMIRVMGVGVVKMEKIGKV